MISRTSDRRGRGRRWVDTIDECEFAHAALQYMNRLIGVASDERKIHCELESPIDRLDRYATRHSELAIAVE